MSNILLSDYKASSYEIPSTKLRFEISEEQSLVTSELLLKRTHKTEDSLFLAGEDLELISLKIDGIAIPKNEVNFVEGGILLHGLSQEPKLEVVTKIYPHKNTSLSGLYQSGPFLCTQNEAEGFRRITYYLDRPDVLSSYEVEIIADKTKYPYLLSNGDLVEQKDLENNQHSCRWVDPFKKPCYLFALVAGDLHKTEDQYTTKSGKNVSLQFFVEEKYRDRVRFAIDSLKDAMRWEEERFNLEYDLSTYMVVATDDFNSGAMENKGLNIFNTKYILSSPKSATEEDYYQIQSVIGHEYFHNWTGNRVTCRDWFQLSLKEGLTVFRDQEFTSDLNSRAVKRIEDVQLLRKNQFTEDAGANAHPVRPHSVGSIDNFYSATVYEKGAEIIRMIHLMIGEGNFQKGMELYWQRFDGMAVTCEDFVKCMADASHTSLDNFFNWYTQPGTPQLSIEEKENSNKTGLEIRFSQSHTPTDGFPEKKNLEIPIRLAFFGDDGKKIAINHPLFKEIEGQDYLFVLKSESAEVDISCPQDTLGSYLRGFSAPVSLKLHSTLNRAPLASWEDDLFNRYENIQNLMQDLFYSQLSAPNQESPIQQQLLSACRTSLANYQNDPAFTALALSVPQASYLLLSQNHLSFDGFQNAYKHLFSTLVEGLLPNLETTYLALFDRYHSKSSLQIKGEKALLNFCLASLLQSSKAEKYLDFADKQFYQSGNMSEVYAALTGILKSPFLEKKKEYINAFEKDWQQDRLVITKLYNAMCSIEGPEAYTNLIAIENKTYFEAKNPNHQYSSLGYVLRNQLCLHNNYQITYPGVFDRIAAFDAITPNAAARLAGLFDHAGRFDEKRKALASSECQRILSKSPSKNLQEILENLVKSLR